MFKLIVLVCAVSQLALAYPGGKIIGGTEAKLGQYPSLVSLQDARTRGHFCGGGLISTRIIITAGHCFADNRNPANSVAYVGSIDKTQGGTTYTLSNVVVHEKFNGIDLFNDITLLKTTNPVTLTANIQPIGLPTPGQNVNGGTSVIAVGWGTTSYPNIRNPNILNYVPLDVVDNGQCATRLNSDISAGQICVGGVDGKGLCFGDSGSPLIMGNTTVGIVSWGQPCGIGYPDVFTRVSEYVNWIQQNQARLESEDVPQ